MMMFSLRPRSGSTFPLIAASVSTLVVSWKEAAERKLFVESEALVIPKQHARRAGRFPCRSADHLLVFFIKLEDVHQFARKHGRIARILDLALFKHLAHNDLKMLIGNLDALHPVHHLDFFQQIF